MKKPDMLILVAVWEFLTAFLAFIGLIAIAVFAFPAVIFATNGSEVAAIFGLSIAAIVLLSYIALAVAGGIGLLNGKEWGRILSIIHAVISLLNIPIGTIIGVLILVYLTRSDVKIYFLPNQPLV